MLATAIGLGALLAAAPAAHAADNCCQVSLDGVPGQLSSGGPAGGFTATFVNRGSNPISSLQLVFSFSGGGQLTSNEIDFERRTAAGDWQRMNIGRHNGTLTAIDSRFRFSQPIQPGSQTSFQYQISFIHNAPAMNVSLGLTVFGRVSNSGGRGDNQQLAQAGPAQIAVLGVGPPPTPTSQPTHSATPTPTVTDTSGALPTDTPTVAPIPADNAAPASGSGGGGSGFVWLAYTVGALLLLAGIGVIGTMLWKRGPQIVETEWPDEDGPADPYQAPTMYGGTTYGSPTIYGPGGVPQQAEPIRGGGRHSLDPTQQQPGPTQQLGSTQHMPRI